jgi:hypothetical protein
MERQILDPIKRLRHKQKAEAKLLTAQHRQRSGALKQYAKIREAKATEKAANAERLKTPPAAVPNGTTVNNQEQLPNPATGLPAPQETGDTAPKGPTWNLPENPEILP